ncbi:MULTISPECIES: hypothetical protein [Gammaproteobacteria]|uniref:hypothetical protein n=1 Tax=Gammaproteobacteria TaxID=1236 RepID=UPI001ADABE7B|nr:MULTISPECIES: hypothetical protein [Gammaproteobacteria]MBO9480452.1 hypothetical protein [Salinisphaera sp. G21_0]MBO9493621.1 hypothetical protein [Thalassotalea sp. G20_0]
MLYVLRDDNNQVCAVSEKPLSNEWQQAGMDDESLMLFLHNNPEISTGIMASSDADFIRVLEDVIDLLIDKQIIQFTEFPDVVQAKLLHRRRYRESLRSNADTTRLLEDGDDSIF